MPETFSVAHHINSEAPSLAYEVEALVAEWLGSLKSRLDQGAWHGATSKHLNDPIWGTIELYPWEVVLLDTPLIQRLRGVRQLGLAQYVFPGAGHDRLEHVCGVVGAVEAMIQALRRQVERWNLSNQKIKLPEVSEERRYELRLSVIAHPGGSCG